MLKPACRTISGAVDHCDTTDAAAAAAWSRPFRAFVDRQRGSGPAATDTGIGRARRPAFSANCLAGSATGEVGPPRQGSAVLAVAKACGQFQRQIDRLIRQWRESRARSSDRRGGTQVGRFEAGFHGSGHPAFGGGGRGVNPNRAGRGWPMSCEFHEVFMTASSGWPGSRTATSLQPPARRRRRRDQAHACGEDACGRPYAGDRIRRGSRGICGCDTVHQGDRNGRLADVPGQPR